MNELWFRNFYKMGILNGEIVKTLRYGNRTMQDNGKPAYCENEVVLVKFTISPYNKIPPIFDKEKTMVKINSLIVGNFRDFRLESLVKSDLQGFNRRAVRENLQRLYSKEIKDWETFTLIEFEKFNISQT